MPPQPKEFNACGVCRRTILHGERIAEYVTSEGTTVGVCALCKSAAEEAGWVPAALAGTRASASPRRGRGLGLRQRLARASEAARGLRTRSGGRDADEGRGARSAAPRQPAEGGPRERGTSRRAAQEARGQRSRAVDRHRDPSDEVAAEPSPAQPPSRERALRQGVEAFNASDEPRKIAGLIRSLGEPQMAVRPSSGGGAVVTVAWELSWYQWEVSPAEDGGGVRETAKGGEVGELAEQDRHWNAIAGADGTVTLDLAGARAATAEGSAESG